MGQSESDTNWEDNGYVGVNGPIIYMSVPAYTIAIHEKTTPDNIGNEKMNVPVGKGAARIWYSTSEPVWPLNKAKTRKSQTTVFWGTAAVGVLLGAAVTYAICRKK